MQYAARPNYNYFALYNKYTGKLCVFYYMDQAHMPPATRSNIGKPISIK